MVEQILKTLAAPMRGITRSISGLHQAAYLIAGLTLASQLLALLRDRIFAGSFGASETLDLYYAAFKVPDLVFALIASLVSAYVIIPHLAGKDPAAARLLLSRASSFLLVAGGALSAVLAAYAPNLLALLFPQFAGSPQFSEFVLLSRLLLIQPILLGLSGILGSVTQLERRFFLFALSPILYNLGIIVGALWLYPAWGLTGLGVGVLLGALAHLLINLPVVIQSGLVPRFTVPETADIAPIVRESIPRSLALSMGAVSLFVLTILAAQTGEGSISVFTLGFNLEAVPLSLIGASYATAAFPVLAKQFSEGKRAEFVATLSAAGRHLIFWSAIFCVLTIVLRAHIVRAILGTGAFDWDATRLTAAILGIFAFALVAQGITLLAARAFYAAGRSWLPFFIQLAGLAVSVIAAFALLSLTHTYPLLHDFIAVLLRVADVPGTDVLMIALGGALGQLAMGLIALLTLYKVAPGASAALTRPIFEGTGAAIVGGAMAYGTLVLMGNIAPLTTLLAVLAQGASAGMVGLIAAGGVLVLLENREFKDLYRALRKEARGRLPLPLGLDTDDRLDS